MGPDHAQFPTPEHQSEKSGSASNPFNLLPLAPTTLGKDEIESYRAEFDYVLHNDDILNIALSGPYGSGKSTLMRTWEGLDEEHSYLHIELAHFNAGDGDSSNSAGREKLQERLEVEILNQLAHKIDPADTPKSRFSRLENINRTSEVLVAVAIALFASLSFVLIRFAPSIDIGSLATQSPVLSVSAALLVASWLLLLVLGLYWVIHGGRFAKAVRKLKLFDAEVDLADTSGTSPFNRNIDEILYLLSNSRYDVLVFEDLDRFDCIGLFEKLRSINALANSTRKRPGGGGKAKDGRANQSKPLKFIYLIRDRLFSDPHDRVKFFDYIISVIPYVDPSNAHDILKRGLEGIGVEAEERFLYGLSTFIDDPRILNAIVDDMFHYKRELVDEGEKDLPDSTTHLLALVTYKQVFPHDFELLQVGHGYLHSLIAGRGNAVKARRDEIQEQVDELRAQLEAVTRERVYSDDELALLFCVPLFSEIASERRMRADPFEGTTSPREILEAIEADEGMAARFDELKTQLLDNEEYVKRLAETEGRIQERTEELQREINALTREMTQLQSASLSELYTSVADCKSQMGQMGERGGESTSDKPSFISEVEKSEYFGLIPYLLSRGAIDESYDHYMSRFYALSLNRADRVFVMTALQGGVVDVEYDIDNVEGVIARLDEPSLLRPTSLNYSLLKGLLESAYQDKLEAYLRNLRVSRMFDFVLDFAVSDQYTGKLFTACPDIALEVLSPSMWTGANEARVSAVRSFCHRMLADAGLVADDAGLRGHFLAFANNDPGFLCVREADAGRIEAIAERLPGIGYHAGRIDLAGVDERLVDVVAENDLYVPTWQTAAALLLYYKNDGLSRADAAGHEGAFADYAGVSPAEQLRGAIELVYRGELPSERGLTPGQVRSYVEENMGAFVESLVAGAKLRESNGAAIEDGSGAAISTGLQAEEDSLCWVLNSKKVTAQKAVELLRLVSGKPIGDINSIVTAPKQEAALACNVVQPTAANVIAYFENTNDSFDEALVGYLNENGFPAGLTFDAVAEELGEDRADDFLDALIGSDLDLPVYDEALRSFKGTCLSFAVDGLESSRAHMLVKTGTVPLTADHLEFFRTSYPALVPELAATDVGAYVRLATRVGSGSAPVVNNEAIKVAMQDSVSLDDAFKLLRQVSASYKVGDDEASALCKAFALKSLPAELLRNVTEYYSELSEGPDAFCDALASWAAVHVDELIGLGCFIPWEMVERMCASLGAGGQGNRPESLTLLAFNLRQEDAGLVSRKQLMACCANAKLADFHRLLSGKQSQIVFSEEAQWLVDELRSIGYCGRQRGPNGKGELTVYKKTAKGMFQNDMPDLKKRNQG